MSNCDQLEAALEVLEDAIQQLRGERYGEYIREELEKLYRKQSPEAQRYLAKAFLVWLSSGVPWKAHYAIVLSSRLNIYENLAALESVLDDIVMEKSILPSYFVQFLEPVIEKLKSNGNR